MAEDLLVALEGFRDEFAASYADSEEFRLLSGAISEIAALRAERGRLRAVIRRVQWEGGEFDRCPCCGKYRESDGHAPNCALAAALGQASGEGKQ